jgi:hypothetical protein
LVNDDNHLEYQSFVSDSNSNNKRNKTLLYFNFSINSTGKKETEGKKTYFRSFSFFFKHECYKEQEKINDRGKSI